MEIIGAQRVAEPDSLAHAQAHALRQTGLTFEEVGKAFGVSNTQARILCLQWERRERALKRLAENPDNIETLAAAGLISRRLANAMLNLERLVGLRIRTVQDMAAIPDDDWPRIPLVGPATIREAKAFLAAREVRQAND